MKYILYFTLRASFAIQNRSRRFCGYLEQDKFVRNKFEQRSEATLALAEYRMYSVKVARRVAKETVKE
jgi:hypothetical protein